MILFPFSLQDPIAAAALFWARALCVQAWSLHPREGRKEMGKWGIPESGFVSCKKKKQNPSLFGKEKIGKHGNKPFETLSGWSHEDNDKSFQSLSLT
jgi:hypothetical protein